MRPRRYQANPVVQPATPGTPQSVRVQPVFFRSMLDTLGVEPWERVPTPLEALVFEEGVDTPFFTRSTLDEPGLTERYRRRTKRAALQPQVLGVGLALLESPDEAVLAVMGEVFEGPSVATRFIRRKVRQKITTTWPTEYDASRFSYLPATTYADNTCRMFSEVQRHFLETTIDSGVTWSLWTAEEVRRLYDLRLSRFLLETELIRVRRSVTVSPNTASYDLPSDTISICRAAFDGEVLTRLDEWQLDNGSVGWESTTGTPYGYIEEGSAGSLKVTLVPTPDTSGTLNLIIVANQAAVEEDCSTVPIPAVFSPYVKWGVIADLLSKEGEANEPQRAAYAEGRFAEGVELARLYTGGGKR